MDNSTVIKMSDKIIFTDIKTIIFVALNWIRLFGVPNAHALKITSESSFRDKQTHMALPESRLRIYLRKFKLFNNVLSFW